MPDIKITYDVRGLDEWVDAVNRFAEELPAACSRALNRTGDQVATAMGRVLADETGMGVRAAREYMEQQPSSPDDLTYIVTVSGEWVPLSEFAPHQTQRGISARPWGQRRVFPGTFEYRDQVFHRVGPERLPIEMLWGPSLAREAERGEALEVAKKTFEEVMPERLRHEISRLWGKKGGG